MSFRGRTESNLACRCLRAKLSERRDAKLPKCSFASIPSGLAAVLEKMDTGLRRARACS